MKLSLTFAFLFFICYAGSAQDIQYTDAKALPLYGKSAVSGPYFHRVDTARYIDMPKRVKVLATHPAGFVIAFKTNSREIYGKWRTKPGRPYKNMTAIASRGLDLYIKREGQWVFAGAGVPGDSVVTTHKIVGNMADGEKECLLFLPMYDELLDLAVGVEKERYLQPLTIAWKGRIVIYGSSITQGTSASRPGIAYPAQLSRRLGYEVVNLGFSGSGKMEESVGRMVADAEADLFILDCAANPSPQEIMDRTENFVKQIREKHPQVPILMIESVVREGGNFDQKIQKRVWDQNNNFRRMHAKLVKDGMQKLYLINGDHLLGHDHEGTVDGTHPNDLGFDRMLQVIEPKVRAILTGDPIAE